MRLRVRPRARTCFFIDEGDRIEFRGVPHQHKLVLAEIQAEVGGTIATVRVARGLRNVGFRTMYSGDESLLKPDPVMNADAMAFSAAGIREPLFGRAVLIK